MRISKLLLGKCIYLLVFIVIAHTSSGQSTPQTLKLTDFAIWGGSAVSTSYNSTQGVYIKEKSKVTGNIGSNHQVTILENFNLTGHIYSGNGVFLKETSVITGNIFANKAASNFPGAAITGKETTDFKGNLTANGKITLIAGSGATRSYVRGQVAVPAPSSTNYSGPVPTGGIVTTVTLPILPVMPDNTDFDSQSGTVNVTGTQTISPGKYKKLALTGSKTLTFNGPGNYIFYEVDNGSSTNKIIFDFKNTTAGTISIFVVKDARWGKMSVSTKNGNFPSRVYTEVHGTGSSSSGFSFNLEAPGTLAAGNYAWLGNVWAPNGSISIKGLKTSTNPHVIGALWSGKKVDIAENLVLLYQAPAAEPNFVAPYLPPPVNGKVTAANNTIGAELLSLSQNTGPISSIPENEIFVLDGNGKVMIEVVSKAENDLTLKNQLIDLGMTGILDNGPHTYIITGFLPIDSIPRLNGNTGIEYVRPLYPPISNTGLVTSQGDVTMRSNVVRSRFGLDGSGVKIGVISDSYDAKLGAQTDVNEGDLPGIKSSGQPNDNAEPVQVVEDLAQRGSDEGRAMLQIVHDVAPKAKLAFHTGFLSAGHFARAIQKLASPTLPGGRCDVIVDDLTYITEPFQRDGVVAQAVNQVVAQGVTYFSSAGNFGNKSYEAVFSGVTNTAAIATGQVHRFGATNADIYQTINLKAGSYTIALQWSDEFSSLGSATGVQTDMDLYLIGANGFPLFGFNRSNLFGDPFEICAFTVREETNAKVMIVRAAGTANVRFKYVLFRGEGTILDYQTGTSSIIGHPNADSAISVGAMLYADIPPFTPVWPGVASFSSRGGTFTKQNTGANFTQRKHPVIVGPNGVNTTVNLGGAAFNDGDTHPNFFGTSAAAPHVAAVGALLIQGRKKYNLQTTVKPFEIRQQLISSAGSFSGLPAGHSYEGGYGYVQADSATAQIANARPVISTLEAVVPGAQNGALPFDVTITGKYLTNTTQIYVNNVPVTTSVTINALTGVGTATATVPAIPSGQDPPFQLFNPAKSPSGLDGGKSEAMYFFSSGVRIVVKAVNKSRKYGQENPGFTAQVLVVVGTDTTDISQTSLTLAGLKLDDLTFTTNAEPMSSPRSYGITVARTTPLPANDPLYALYAFQFVPGELLVEKMTLKITPNNMVVKYGDDLSGISYVYELDTSGVLTPHLLEEVKSLHKQYLAENGLVVVNGYNNINSDIAPFDLRNMSVLTSFQSILNARKFIVENGQLKALVSDISTSQIGEQRFVVDVSAQSLQNYKLNPVQSNMVDATATSNARTFLNVKALTNGSAKAAVPNGELQPMVNGQLLTMVNGELETLINGQLRALVNGVTVDVSDITFQNGQLRALVNGSWIETQSGQILAVVNGAPATVDLSMVNGQLRALVNNIEMTLVNGQLRALVNGQTVALINGQLRALVNGQLLPLVNGELVAFANGQLQPIVDGQLVAIVNGQLMVESEDGDLEIADEISLVNGQLRALVNGQLRALVNGQLKALVNGVITDVPTTSFSLVNGQLRALVNGQETAYVNGQLKALVNGQLRALVNGEGLVAESVIQLANGQLKALVNGSQIPIANGQLRALVNGQLLGMVNGQLMAVVNGQLTFIVFQNGQLKALVNGALENYTFTNGQLKALVNGELQTVNSAPIVNGTELHVVVNGDTWVYPNGQLKALVNGQLQPLINNFDVSGTNNNANTLVLVDEDDINLQGGDVGGMLSMNMITGLDAGNQTLIPAAFINENFDVTYGAGLVYITKKPLYVTAENKSRNEGEENPELTVAYEGFAYNDGPASVCVPIELPASPTSIDRLERRTTYTDVQINGSSNIYYATPGELLNLTGNWGAVYYSDLVPGYIPYCPGCITQLYIGMANDQFSGNVFDVCYDASGTFPVAGTLGSTFNAPTRPGVYYITQRQGWDYYCYQFGHQLHDQIAKEAIAVVIVEPSAGITGNTAATETSPAGEYPIILGGCHFNPNYRIVFKDGTLTVTPGTPSRPGVTAQPPVTETKKRETRLYPNPATSVVRVQLENDVRSVNDFQVFDVIGKTGSIVTKRINEGTYEVDISRLAKGVYFIRANTVAGIKTFRFMKM